MNTSGASTSRRPQGAGLFPILNHKGPVDETLIIGAFILSGITVAVLLSLLWHCAYGCSRRKDHQDHRSTDVEKSFPLSQVSGVEYSLERGPYFGVGLRKSIRKNLRSLRLAPSRAPNLAYNPLEHDLSTSGIYGFDVWQSKTPVVRQQVSQYSLRKNSFREEYSPPILHPRRSFSPPEHSRGRLAIHQNPSPPAYFSRFGSSMTSSPSSVPPQKPTFLAYISRALTATTVSKPQPKTSPLKPLYTSLSRAPSSGTPPIVWNIYKPSRYEISKPIPQLELPLPGPRLSIELSLAVDPEAAPARPPRHDAYPPGLPISQSNKLGTRSQHPPRASSKSTTKIPLRSVPNGGISHTPATYLPTPSEALLCDRRSPPFLGRLASERDPYDHIALDIPVIVPSGSRIGVAF